MYSTSPLGTADPRRLGPYFILGRLGGGGMGVVYLGQTPERRLVSIKAVREDLDHDPEFRARFKHEVGAVSGVAGFCTARMLDADVDAERPWYASEFIEGPTLREAVDERGPLKGQQLLGFAVGVAEALEAIHAAGVIHRDLKPSNVLLSPTGPKVIDFGIARQAGQTALTQTGMLVGSLNWLSPEQLRGETASPASDVFAWGGLVAYAAGGEPPYGTGSAEAVSQRLLHDDPDLRGLHGPLLEAVRPALRKDPRQRPSPKALLERLVGGAPADPVAAATDVVQRTWVQPSVQPSVQPAVSGAAAPAPLRESARERERGQRPTPAGGQQPRPRVVSQPVAPSVPPRLRPAPTPFVPPQQPRPQPVPHTRTPVLPQAPGPAAPSPSRPAQVPEGRAQDRDRAGTGERRDPPRSDGRIRVLADLLPGGLLRDLALVAAFAALEAEALASDDPVSSIRVTSAMLLTLAGAALLGRRRAFTGFLFGIAALYGLIGHNGLPSLGDVGGYLLLASGIVLTGTLARVGRRHKAAMAAFAMAVGFAFVWGVLQLNLHIPNPNVHLPTPF